MLQERPYLTQPQFAHNIINTLYTGIPQSFKIKNIFLNKTIIIHILFCFGLLDEGLNQAKGYVFVQKFQKLTFCVIQII